MSTTDTKFHKIWIEQCAAAEDIRERYGIESALQYLVGEKLMSFLEASEQRAEFAEELPRFVEKIKLVFLPEEISHFLDGLESQSTAAEDNDVEDEDELLESPVLAAEALLRFARVRALLISSEGQ